MLASKPWDFVVKSSKRFGMKAFTSNTITALDELATELERVRKNGYAFEIEEMVSELCAVATPIHNHNGEIIASMSISVPAYRFSSQKASLQQEAVQSAQRISQKIGYDPVLMKGKGGFKWHSVRGKDVLRAH